MAPTATSPEPPPAAASSTAAREPSTTTLPKLKRKHPPPSTPQVLHTATLHPTSTYLHLTLLPSFPVATGTSPLDASTARLHILAALTQYLGDHGAAIPVDILHLEAQDVWVRVPVQDGVAVVAALSAWIAGRGVAWRIKGRGEWLGALVGGGDGQGLFT